MAVRVTQIYVENIIEAPPLRARVTQIYVENVRSLDAAPVTRKRRTVRFIG